MHQKNDDPGGAPPTDNLPAEVRQLLTQEPPAPIDIAVFGKRMADIVNAAVRNRMRRKF
jgi:hypothetical protein